MKFIFFSFSSSGFVRISPRGLEIMKKITKPQKTFSWSRKKVFSSPIHHEKNQKNEKTKKKIEILFGRPNSSTVFKFSRKIKSKKTFSENHKMAARVSSMFISPSNYPQENKYWRPAGNYLCTIFVSPHP